MFNSSCQQPNTREGHQKPTTAALSKLDRAVSDDREVKVIEDGTYTQREGKVREWQGRLTDLTDQGWPGWFRIRRTDGQRSRPPEFHQDALVKLTFIR